MDARAAAAFGILHRAGLTVEALDHLHWRVLPVVALIQPVEADKGYLFWPATGYWRRPDGSFGAGGPVRLIDDMRRATSNYR